VLRVVGILLVSGVFGSPAFVSRWTAVALDVATVFWVCFQMFQGFESSSGAVQMLHVDRTFDVLITDDNASFRRVLREVLEDRPFLRLLEAESGEQALEVVTIQRIDIVLLDMHMHVLTGLETLKVLKRLDRLRPCILITSDTSDELHRDAREAEAFSVLRKPVPPRQLLQTVSTALASAYSA
jgi:CheY-like chemotaxis protein